MTAGHHFLHTPVSLGSAATALSFDLASHLQPLGTACPSYPYSLSLDHTHITSCQCHPIVMILEETRLLRWGLARCYNLERWIQEGNPTPVSASSRLISLVHRLLNLFPGFTRATVTLGYWSGNGLLKKPCLSQRSLEEQGHVLNSRSFCLLVLKEML